MRMNVAVVIVTFNSGEVIGDLLDSLPTALRNLTADVVVVDNGSTDNTRDTVRSREDCRLLVSTNVGYAGGINAGVRAAAPADTIVILNPDLRLHESAIEHLHVAAHLPGGGISAPKVLNSDGSLFYSLRRKPSLGRAMGLSCTKLPTFSEYVADRNSYDSPRTADWALGAVLAISRPCWDAVGEWDPSFFLYSEETDFCLRAQARGFQTWYEPRAVCAHLGAGSGQTDKTHAMQIINRVRLFRRYHGPMSGCIYYFLTLFSEMTWMVRGHVQSRAAIWALLRPSLRPAELGCSTHMIPQ
jgi:N-acetylglucosaminyl-diphospho-decaprenol L-rhamnosyltransferase